MRSPEKRNPATTNGKVNRKAQASKGADHSQYEARESVARVDLYQGRLFLGTIFEADGAHQAFDPVGVFVGVFPTRTLAARAFRDMQPAQG